MLKELVDCNGWMNFKEMERRRGFLLYVTRTYPSMVPYLKGIHLTLDSWRPQRDMEGWKDSRIPLPEDAGMGSNLNTPQTKVKAVSRLVCDLKALEALTSSDKPPRRQGRSKIVHELLYGFGDASATGFCGTFQTAVNHGRGYKFNDQIHYQYGHWCAATSEASSNYRELLNLVQGLESLVREKDRHSIEVFLFTDNSTAEAVFYKGNSTSKKLFE